MPSNRCQLSRNLANTRVVEDHSVTSRPTNARLHAHELVGDDGSGATLGHHARGRLPPALAGKCARFAADQRYSLRSKTQCWDHAKF